MNPYTTKTQARIRHCDIENILRTNSYLAGASIAALEWQRGCLAEAEMHRLLKQYDVSPNTPASVVSMLRQTIGAALVRAGERLGGAPERGTAPAMAPEASTPQTVV